MRKKYANKTPLKRFLHKYTGIIVLTIILSVVILFWTYNEVNKVFFENWTCNEISEMKLSDLDQKSVTRYHEIISECTLLPFTQ